MDLVQHPSGIVPTFVYVVVAVPLVLCCIHVLLCGRNIVSTVNLNVKLDLKNIALHARNAEYNPKVDGCVFLWWFC